MSIVYVAGASAEPERVRHWMDRIRAAGHELAFDWLTVIALGGGHANVGLSDEQRRSASWTDLDAIDAADIVWLLAPDVPSCGAWAELGYAVSVRERDRRHCYGRPLHIVVSGRARERCIFASLADFETDSDGVAFEWLQELSR